jgi:hypothetical protein
MANPRKEAQSRSSGLLSRRIRKAIFTFSHQYNFDLDLEGINTITMILGVRDDTGIKTLAIRQRHRDDDTEAAYSRLDRLILPKMRLEIFFNNFSDPGLIFANPKNFDIDMRSRDPRLKSCRITYFALSDRKNEKARKRLALGLEAKILLNVLDDVDIENPEEVEGTNLQDQIRECRNMFNFFIKDFEYYDDEGLDHEWSAAFA